MRLALAGFCTAALCGCSVVVGELDLRCEQPSDCNALNAEHGLNQEQDCFIYQCRADSRGCERRAQDLDGDGAPARVCKGELSDALDCDDGEKLSAPGLREECDGKDNDCDGFIDEALFGETDLIHEVVDRQVVHVSHGFSAESQLLIAMTSKDGDKRKTGLWRLEAAAQSSPAHLMRFGSLATDDANIANCDEPTGASHCAFTEIALGIRDELVLGLGVNAAGCDDGQLRIGVDKRMAALLGDSPRSESSGEQPPDFVWDDSALATPASPAANDLLTGIDRAADTRCSLSGDQQGASSPRLALLPNDSRWRSLALWRAGPADTPAPLVGLALWLDDGLLADASGGGRSETLDLVPGSDPASIGAWAGAHHSGHFIAYDAEDRVELAFIPALGGPSQPLVQQLKRGHVASEEGARHPALAVLSDTDTLEQPRGLAVAWREGGGGDARVLFAEVSFDPAADADAFRAEPPITLSERGQIVEGPVMVAVDSGLTSPTAAPGARDGGWFVAWLEQDGAQRSVFGVRVAESTGTPVEPPFPLYRGGQVEHLFAYTGEPSTAGYGFITEQTTSSGGQTAALNIGSLSCRDP